MSEILKGAEQLNTVVRLQTILITKNMFNRLAANKLTITGNLFQSLRYRITYNAGEAEKISWNANRYGFVLSNVGKNYTLQRENGAKITRKTGKPISRKRKIIKGNGDLDWVFKEIARGAEVLANEIAEINANRVVSATSVISTVNNKNL